MEERLLVKNGLVVDPANKIERRRMDILIEAGRISRLAQGMKPVACAVLDAADKIVIPGIVDMHVHLREPGREDKETIASGTKAALKGGVTSVLAMANTNPAPDTKENVLAIKNIIDKSANANVFICGAITTGRAGRQLVDMPSLMKEGVIAVSDDGNSVDEEAVLREALREAAKSRIKVICHCEDKALSTPGGVVNLGFTSTRMGLRGISRESEYKRVQRNIQLAEKTNTPIHIAHVSCRESVGIIREAKKRDVKLTCETAPHYFTLSEDDILGYDTNMKINPPLRSKEDVEAIRQALKDGTIDAIASDHAPHTPNEKEIEFDRAEFGTIGLETELAVAVTHLVKSGILDWPGLAEKMSLNPARILGLDKGTLSPGADADIAIINPDAEWTVRQDGFASKSRNSAFIGKKLTGLVEYTILSGTIAWERGRSTLS